MNLEEVKGQKNIPPLMDDFELDFKPITSGLGFHHQKQTEVKPVMTERTVTVSPLPSQTLNPKKEIGVYQSDLSMFYNQAAAPEMSVEIPELKLPEEKHYPLATKTSRVFAYLADLAFIGSILGIVLTVMARTTGMDLVEIWKMFPDEITPLFFTLFCGFYILYFSIFEKTNQSTLGKSLFQLRVTDTDCKSLSLVTLILRSTISLLNFVSLGLFSYFDLQNKVTSSKVIRIK
jgi:uncharacterized RDD family membrane protein YckC